MAKKIKVLILSHSSELSGAERSMVDVINYGVKQGYIEPHFIIRQPIDSLAAELDKQGYPYTAIHYTNWSQRNPSARAEDIFRNALFNSQATFEIEKIIQQVKPDVVMTNTIVAPWAALAAYFQRVPHVWFVREYGDIDHRHVIEIGKQKMLEDINTLSCLVATNSVTLGKHISPPVDSSKIVPVYTPFDLELLERKSRQAATNPFKNPASLKLVITGKIAPGKGQVEAVEAVAGLAKQGFDTELCIIGKIVEPGDDKQLLATIAQHNLEDKVHLIGHISNPLAVLKFADVGIMASKQEAFGRVTFEYMSIGLPVVGANSGATPEMVDEGINGYLYKQGDSKSLATKLVNYAKNRELITKHGKAAQAKTTEMMNGAHNAEAFYRRLQSTLASKNLEIAKPLNFSHRWLEYPSIARRYIDDSGVISIKRLLYQRLRHRAKLAYIITDRAIRYGRRGFKRNPTYGKKR